MLTKLDNTLTFMESKISLKRGLKEAIYFNLDRLRRKRLVLTFWRLKVISFIRLLLSNSPLRRICAF